MADTKIRYIETERSDWWEQEEDRLIFLNPRKLGCSLQWRTRKNGYKTQLLLEDPELQTAEDFTSIGFDKCRCCKGDNTKPYTEKYYDVHPYPDSCEFFYCFENGYCEECAKKKTENYHSQFSFIAAHVIEQKYQEIYGKVFVVEKHKNGDVVMYAKT